MVSETLNERTGGAGGDAYLDIACPAVKVEVQIFDLTKFRKFVLNVLLGSLLVDVGDKDNPSFYG